MPTLRMKDGTRIRVKEGADYDAIAKKYYADRNPTSSLEYQDKVKAQQEADRAEYDPTKGMSTLEKLAVGNTQGFARVGRGLANMVGLKSDEDTAAANKLDEPLLKTGAGKVGSFVGNTAALTGLTAPLGAAGGLVRGGGPLARTLTAGAGNATLQGAVGGAVNADPGARGEGAALGGVLGGGIYGLLKLGGRLASGLVKVDPDAAALGSQLGEHIPLSSAAATDDAVSSAVKKLYEVAEATPIAGSQLAKQRAAVEAKLVKTLGARSTPVTATGGVKPIFTPGTTPAARAANTLAVSKVDDAIQAVTGPMKNQTIQVGGAEWQQTIGKKLFNLGVDDLAMQKEIQNAIDKAIGKGVPITNGERLLDAISKLKKLRNKTGGTNNVGKGAKISEAIRALEELGRKANLTNWDKALKIYDKELWAWNNLKRSLVEGSITPASLEKGLKGSVTSRATGSIPNQQLTELGKRVLVTESPEAGGYFKTMLGLGNLGLVAGAGLTGGPVGALVAGGALPLLATKTAQRTLTGQTRLQRAIVDALRRNPESARDIAARLANAATPQGQ